MPSPPSSADLSVSFTAAAPTGSSDPGVSFSNSSPSSSGDAAVTFSNTSPSSSTGFGVTFSDTCQTEIAVTDETYRMLDGVLSLYNPTTNRYHPIWIEGAGDPQIAVGDPDDAAGANYQISGSTLLILNVDTSEYLPVSVTGTSPAFVIAIGETADRPSNYRIRPHSLLQLANLTSERWHSVALYGSSPAYSLALAEITS